MKKLFFTLNQQFHFESDLFTKLKNFEVAQKKAVYQFEICKALLIYYLKPKLICAK